MYISRPTKWLDNLFSRYFDFAREKEVRERGVLNGAASRPEGRELSWVLGMPKTGAHCCFPSLHYHHKPFPAIPLLQKPAKAEYSSVPIFDTAFISEAKLLKEEAVRDDQGLEKCRK